MQSQPSPIVSGTELLHGAGVSRDGVAVQGVQLESSKSSATYRARLQWCLAFFVQWLTLRSVTSEWWQDEVVANQLLCDCIQYMYENKIAMQRARRMILGVQTAYKPLRGRLGRAWSCLATWQMKVPTWSRVPLTADLLHAMFSTALAMAFENSREACLWMAFGILLRVGFVGLLRPKELVNCRACDVRLPRTRWEPKSVVLRLVEPKNKASLGRYQFVLIKDASLVDWLCWMLEGISPMARLWPSSQSSFSKFFRRCLERLGLTRLRLSPGSLRPGGATAHFLHFSSISILRILGRWRVESSLDHYIQTVVSHLCHADLDDKEFETISILIDRTVAQWNAPPAVPWTSLYSRAKQWSGLQQASFLRPMTNSTTSRAMSSRPAALISQNSQLPLGSRLHRVL